MSKSAGTKSLKEGIPVLIAAGLAALGFAAYDKNGEGRLQDRFGNTNNPGGGGGNAFDRFVNNGNRGGIGRGGGRGGFRQGNRGGPSTSSFTGSNGIRGGINNGSGGPRRMSNLPTAQLWLVLLVLGAPYLPGAEGLTVFGGCVLFLAGLSLIRGGLSENLSSGMLNGQRDGGNFNNQNRGGVGGVGGAPLNGQTPEG